jgi:hypothetical protein
MGFEFQKSGRQSAKWAESAGNETGQLLLAQTAANVGGTEAKSQI